MTSEITKIYDPKGIEAQAQEIWRRGRYWHAQTDFKSAKGTYTIVIPPPNVTAALHLGHALNNTLQDILIRWKRMQGFNTLWMPGTDHAGIATQTVVEKRLLAEQGKRRKDFQREEFVAHVQAWKDEYEACILGQLKSMGCSCDWERTRFTMDDICARAVRTNFFNLFKDGLIYRGKRLVNWDPATQTVLADDEVEHETIQGHFWYLQYPLTEPVTAGGKKIAYVTVATTRPETMLGDTAVAMNPADPRASSLVGKQVRLPIVGRRIPIIADEHVVLPDPNSEDEKAGFSTGFLKVTPAHDPDDWEIGRRHNLEVINVMAPDGSISDKYGWTDWEKIKNPEVENLIGMDRFEAREAVVEWFRQENLLEEVRDYTHEVGHSYRSHVPIEPYLSDQWYIAVKKPIDRLAAKFGSGMIEGTDVPVNSLAGLALKPLLDGRLRFVPERYAKTYQAWLENLRDWPISRQLWWGHRIPVWSCDTPPVNLDSGKTATQKTTDDQGRVRYYVCVKSEAETLEKELEKQDFVRDDDVLDTWFSSALWPFSTLGWPEPTPELKTFYPTQVLCTAREIITLWVSRMVMMGQYCVGDIPFRDVYIHAMIQDGQGRKMSKSLGNGIDPLVAIDSHGADAMRFTLAQMTTETQDIRMPVSHIQLPDGRKVNSSPKFDIGRNFCNKLWNASRFAMMNLDGIDPDAFDASKLDTTDRWILSRLARTIQDVNSQLEQFKFNEPVNTLYRFFWNDLCDWYLEWIKPRMADPAGRPIAQNVLAFVLDQTIRLMHPFVPFITEGIFQALNDRVPRRMLKGIAEAKPAPSVMTACWPQPVLSFVNETIERQIDKIQNVIRVIREIRNKYTIAPAVILTVSICASEESRAVLSGHRPLIQSLAGVGEISIGSDLQKPKTAAAGIVEDMQIFVHDVIDPAAERQRLEKQKEFIENGIRPLQAKLSNESFISRAKPEVVEQSRRKLEDLTEQLKNVNQLLSEFL
jgi:valyl-tRNA synthetase